MSGQLSTLNSFLTKYDPHKIIKEMVDLQTDYNKDKTYFGKHIDLFEYIRLKWIEKWRYPKLKRKTYNIQRQMADLLFDHPDYLLLISQRSIGYIIQFCIIYELDVDEYIKNIFNDAVTISIKKDESEEGILKIQAYTIIVRSPIPLDIDDESKDKFSITTLDVQCEDRTYSISQDIYDCKSMDGVSMANLIASNRLDLSKEGRLSNPNYAISREIFETDMNNYRIMIAQILVFIIGSIQKSTDMVFIQVPEEDCNMM